MKSYDRSKSGFTGKKHTEYSKWLMSEGRKRGWAIKKKNIEIEYLGKGKE